VASVLLLSPWARPQAPPAPAAIDGYDVYDGFEAPTLSDLWETNRFVPGAVTLQSVIVRAGHGAVRIDLHPRDRFGAGKDGDPDTERDEVMEASRLTSREDTPYEYSWSMYLPADFPIVPVRLVVAQWKQECPVGTPLADHAPNAPASLPATSGPSHRFPCDNDIGC
jgi:hypothetical protein